MATIAPVFTRTSAPYGREQVRERTDADLRRGHSGDGDEHEAPERDAGVPRRRRRPAGPGHTPRTSTSMTIPPTQSAAPTRCSPSAVTAASWLAVPRRGPAARAGRGRSSTTPAVRATMPRERTAKQSTVTAAATSTVTSQARPRSVPVRNTPIDWPNCSSRLIRDPATLRNVKKVATADATVQTPAGGSRDVDGAVPLGAGAREPDGREREPADGRCGRQVDDDPGDRQPEPDDGPGSAIRAGCAPPPMTSAASSATNRRARARRDRDARDPVHPSSLGGAHPAQTGEPTCEGSSGTHARTRADRARAPRERRKGRPKPSPRASEQSYLTAALSFEPALTLTESLAAISMASPVCGLRPVRAARCVFSKAIQPGIVTFVPSATDPRRR